MAARLTGFPNWQFFSSTGAVLAGGTINFYTPGTTDAKSIYDATDKQTTLTNPVTLDAAGRVPSPIFGEGLYDVVIKDSSGNTIESISNWGDDWSAVGTDLSSNPLSNHSFETAGSGEPFANWTETDSGTVITRDTTDPYHGGACALFTSSQNGADYVTSDAFEVSPAYRYAFTFAVKASNASAEPKIQVEWLTAAQASISTSTIYDSDAGLTPTSWTLVQSVRATPPATARYAKVIVVGNDNATQYTVRVDGIVVRPVATFPDEAPYAPYGLVISRDSGDTDHDIKVTAGAVKADDYADDLILSSDIVKQLDVAFAEGTAAGGAASGFSLPASDVFAIWLIKDSSTGHVDVLADTSFSSPTMPTGYDVKRRIGAWVTDASNNLIDGRMKGNRVDFFVRTEIVNDSTLTTGTDETGTAKCPPFAVLRYMSFADTTSSDYAGELWSTVKPTGSTNWGGFGVDSKSNSPSGGVLDNFYAEGDVVLDASAQFEYNLTFTDTSSVTLTLYQIGWTDLVRNDP